MAHWRLLASFALIPGLSACATLDELAVGRTDRLNGAPFYKTYAPTTAAGEHLAVLPVTVDAVTREEYPADGRQSLLEPVTTAFDTYVSARACRRVLEWPLAEHGGPRLYVGSAEGEAAPAEAADHVTEYEKYPPMVIHLEKPRPEWRQQAQSFAAAEGLTGYVIIHVGLTQYPKADRGAFGKKVVLGTHHEQPIRFLSAELKPVEVLQVTGMLLDAQGNVLRAGAEGILARDAPFLVQSMEAGRDIDDVAIDEMLVDERRTDLPGAPLAWQVALDHLLWQLGCASAP